MQVPHPLLSSLVPVMANPALPQARRDARAAEDALVKSRLGVYSGLFYALRAKHPPTAAHSLRVAMGCSKWACSRGMPEADRDMLEVSALLHDLGKIGVPDNVLQKPSQLEGHEQLMMEMSCSMATEMLRGAGAGDEVIRIVEQARIAFQDQQHQLPSAHMMAIVDAFDSMTTEQVFRRAMSRERAIEELCALPEHSSPANMCASLPN